MTPRPSSSCLAGRGSSTLAVCLALTFCLGGALAVLGQSDDFDDGNSEGWTQYDREGTATFSFPDGGYRIQASSSPGGSEQDKAYVLAYRDPEYTDFYAAVDLKDWDNSVRSAIGLFFRGQSIGPTTTAGYVLYWTPAIAGGGNRLFSIYFLLYDQPTAALAATYVTLDPAHDYRMEVTGTGSLLQARIYDLADLTMPVAELTAEDLYLPMFGMPMSGKCGVFAYSRDNTTADVTFDNYVASATRPATVPQPGTPHPVAGTPQIVSRVPASTANFHDPADGISFTATTLGGGEIAPSGIRLLLNGSDVSSALSISGPANNRSVSYQGLASNRAYEARITVSEIGGKASTNDFFFDTFSESYVTSSVVKLVQAEDYNYDGGKYQDDPPPSGVTPLLEQIYGTNDLGYYATTGTPEVDYHDYRTSPESGYNVYRGNDYVGTFAGTLHYIYTDSSLAQLTAHTNDTLFQKFASLDLPDYQVHHTEGGEWLNYTRTFAPGRYHAFLRTSAYSPQDVLLDEVTGNRTQTNQATVEVGSFKLVNTGHISRYRYFQLVDAEGDPKVLNWSGLKTFRLTMGGPQEDFTRYALQLNYLLFVPAPAGPVLLLNPVRAGDAFSVSFASEAGATYRLQYKHSLGDVSWTNGGSVAGDGTVKTLSDTSAESMRFYRVATE